MISTPSPFFSDPRTLALVDGPERTLTLEPVTSPVAATASGSLCPDVSVGVVVVVISSSRRVRYCAEQ